jgi:uncharacterized membrane protein
MLEQFRNRATLSLIISVVFGLLLLAARIIVTGSSQYLFLVWNLILAAIPYAVVLSIRSWNLHPKRLIFWPLMILWLLFLPNAPYITTDLLHLRSASTSSVWFDSLLTLNFAFNGIVLFFLALQPVQAMVASRSGVVVTWGFVGVIAGLSAFGIYLGRFVRFNSWDLLVAPGTVMEQVWERIADPFSYTRTWAMTLLYTGFLVVTYYMLWALARSSNRAPTAIA